MSKFLFDALTQINKISAAVLLPLMLLLAFVIFIPDKLATALAVAEFRIVHKQFLGPAFLLAVSMLAAKALIAVGEKVKSRRKHRLHEMQLHELTAEERGYLLEFLKGANTIYVSLDDGIAGGLLRKAILYVPSYIHDIIRGIGYNLEPWARIYLKKHPELLQGATPRPSSTREPDDLSGWYGR